MQQEIDSGRHLSSLLTLNWAVLIFHVKKASYQKDLQHCVLQTDLEFVPLSESRLSKTKGTIQWIHSEGSEIHLVISNHSSPTAEELTWKVLQPLSRKTTESLCAHAFCWYHR